MPELDPLSRAIGALEAFQQEARRQHEAIVDELGALGARLGKVERLAGEVKRQGEHLAQMKPAVEEFQRLKQRGLGMLAGIGLVSGAGGVALGPALKALLAKWWPG